MTSTARTRYAVTGCAAWITLDSPENRNALSVDLIRELGEHLRVANDDASVRVIVLTGEGRAFCAGADLKNRGEMGGDGDRNPFVNILKGMRDGPKPVIAAVNGAAFGGGLELVAAADFAYAAAEARFALTEVTLGIIPGAAGTQNLPRAVGVRRAKEIVLTGLPFSAEDALRWGLINRLCDDQAALRAQSLETARRIAANAPIAVRQAKKALTMATQLDLKSGYMFELEAYGRTVPTQDRQEGVRAFGEKRAPKFEGR